MEWRLAFVVLSAWSLQACDTKQTDREIACSIVASGKWKPASGEFEPEGSRRFRLSPEDRARALNKTGWRPIPLNADFRKDPSSVCGAPSRSDVEAIAISDDGRLARVEVADSWSKKMCLGERDGEGWRERECDTFMTIEPISEPPPDLPSVPRP